MRSEVNQVSLFDEAAKGVRGTAYPCTITDVSSLPRLRARLGLYLFRGLTTAI
jgi:hypothetical protein